MKNILVVVIVLLISGCVTKKELAKQSEEQAQIKAALEDNIVVLKKLLNQTDSKSETAITINKILDNVKFKADSLIAAIDAQTGKKTKTRLNNLRLRKEILSESVQNLKVVQIAVEKVVSEKLESDLSFDVGRFDLKAEGQKQLDDMIRNIILQVQFWNDFPNGEQPKKYADTNKKVAVNISGYADLQGSVNAEQRMKYNLELSNNRAKAVRNYFEAELNKLATKEKIEIIIKSTGKGEELPVGVKNTTKIDNPERRVCVITLGVIPAFE